MDAIYKGTVLIDLHCHMLPGIDDGAPTLDVALQMAAMAVADGILTTVCTPHILPGVFNNEGPSIRSAVARFQDALQAAGIPLQVLPGADVHIGASLVEGLQNGRVLSLAGSRYLLLEPPHHVFPPHLRDCVFGLLAAGYIPVLTHPERLTWLEKHYHVVEELAAVGVPMQITAGSFTGRFGKRAKHLALRMLDDGIVDIIATDAHDLSGRPPRLSAAKAFVVELVGADAAERLVVEHPRRILDNLSIPALLTRKPKALRSEYTKRFWHRAFAAIRNRSSS